MQSCLKYCFSVQINILFFIFQSKLLNRIKNLDIRSVLNADREKARNVDRISRVLFPIMFLTFNLVFWLTYIYWEPQKD
jgi:hypothetical protein